MSQSQRILIAITGTIIILAILLGLGFTITSPARAAKSFGKALQEQNKDAALAMVPDYVSETEREDITFFVEDWVESGKPTISIDNVEGWRERPREDDANKTETVPTPRHWAHYTNVSMTVSFDEYEDPVVLKLTRKTDNGWSMFAQLFRGWNVTGISYQTDEEEIDEEIEDIVTEETPINGTSNTNSATNEATEEVTGAEVEEEFTEPLEEEEDEGIVIDDDVTGNADGEAESVDDSFDEGNIEVFDAGLIEQ